MPFYRLNDSFALRSYTNKVPLIVKYGNPGFKHIVSNEEMSLLKKCDGVNSFNFSDLSADESSALKKMIANNYVSELNEPLPLKAHRAYKEFNHKRIAQATWAITIKCNMNCLHCLNLAEDLSVNEPEFTLEEAKIIINKLVDYGVEAVEFFGGEPTIYPYFMQVVRMIYEAGMQINSIDTNGMLINEKMLDEFEEIGAHPRFAISFDGLGTHEWLRNRKGCEEKVIEAIKLCVNRGFETNVAININKKTLPVLDKTVDYFINIGVKRFKLLRTSESFRWMQTEKQSGEKLTIDLIDFSALMVEFIKKYLPVIRSRELVFNINHSITIGPKTRGKSLFSNIEIPLDKLSGWCPVAENGVFIGYQGYVAPCPGPEGLLKLHRLYSDDINLLKRSLEDIIYSDFYTSRFRITCSDVYNTSEECRKCNRWNECHGGFCRMNATMDPKCIAAGAPPEKYYFAQKDVACCAMMKGSFTDSIANILDGNI